MTAHNATFARRRAQRALGRQLDYQQQKAQKVRGHEPQLISAMTRASAEVRAQLQQVRSIADDARYTRARASRGRSAETCVLKNPVYELIALRE